LRLNGERQLRAIEERARMADDAAILESSTVPVTATGEPDRVRERLEKLKSDLHQVETQFTSKHPDVQRLKDEIARIERTLPTEPEAKVAAAPQPGEAIETVSRLRRSRRQSITALDSELEKLKQEETRLRASITDVEGRLQSLPARQQELALVSRDRQSAKDLYDSLLKRYEEAQLVESMEADRQGERFRVLEAAVAPEGPNAPNRPFILLLGVLAALGLAGVAVVAAEQIDTSFHSLDELKAFTSVPVLATVPAITAGRGRAVGRAALVSASILIVVGLSATVAAVLARGNEGLVRLLVRSA
jgi:uncharacterized protein involved in exopolysaccharide biosynthesis